MHRLICGTACSEPRQKTIPVDDNPGQFTGRQRVVIGILRGHREVQQPPVDGDEFGSDRDPHPDRASCTVVHHDS